MVQVLVAETFGSHQLIRFISREGEVQREKLEALGLSISQERERVGDVMRTKSEKVHFLRQAIGESDAVVSSVGEKVSDLNLDH